MKFLDILIKIHGILIELHEINCDNITESLTAKDEAINKTTIKMFPLKPDLRANEKIKSLSLKIANLDCSPLFGRGRGFHYDDLELRRHNLQTTYPFTCCLQPF